MLSDLSPLLTAVAVSHGALALAALGAVAALARGGRGPGVPTRSLAVLLVALAIGVAASAFAPLLSVPAVEVGGGITAIVAWGAVVLVWRPVAPAPPPVAAPRLLDIALAACGDGVVIAAADDRDGLQIVYSNPAFEQLTGYTSDEALGLSPSILADEPDGLEAIRQAVRSSEAVCVELPGRRKDGTRVWAEWQIVPVADAAGRHTHSVAVLRETTARRRAERALRQSEARARELFEQAADMILVLDRTGRIVDANRQACHTLGYTRDELTALNAGDLEAKGSLYDFGLEETVAAECTYRRKDGSTLSVEVRYAVVETAGGQVNLALVRDVTRRRRAELALREREELLRSVIAHIPCGVLWKDRDSVYLGCNEQVARDLGLAGPRQVVGRSDLKFTSDAADASADRDRDRHVMESGRPLLNTEESHARLDGSYATVLTSKVPLRDARGKVVGVLGVYQDITDRQRLEEQLRQAQKMEAIGRLAGGIAHDFNNLLTVIRGNTELLRSPSEDARTAALFDDLLLAADRAAALVRQLLMFSRRQPARVEVLDLNEVVTSLSGLLCRLLGERVAVETVLAPAPVTVRADRSHLEQVVMNLAVNARDAMPGGGTVTVRTAAEPVAGGAGRVARLAVTDTGTGMTEAVKARIFEPFFTTKGPDKGTGLGLATVFGIVQQAAGHIGVESAPGAGTTFRVDLPWWNGSASALVLTPGPRMTPAPSTRGVSILLVEDQDAIRRFARLALEGQGHRVAEAEDGEAALDLVRAGGAYDLLVTDVTMPGIDGRELATRVRALRPDIAVVVMSGYAPDSELAGEIDRSVFLAKPFPPADLFAALKRALRLVRCKQAPRAALRDGMPTTEG